MIATGNSSSGEPSGSNSALSGSRDLPRKLFDYDIVQLIGEGAGSAIYVVTHPTTKQLFALKHVKKTNEKEQRFIDQLVAEFEVAKKFTHPVLRRCYEYKDNKSLFKKANEAALIMELFDGLPLDRKSLDLKQKVEVFIQMAQGLSALHAMGYGHFDLKPANVLVDASNQARIIDFGQAAKLGSIKERIQGTPDYIAPEQVKCEPVTVKTDVFNFGATLYFALANKTIPTLFTIKRSENSFLVDHAIPSPRDIDNTVPEPLSNLVMECCRINVAKRPNDFAELTRRLEVIQHSINLREKVA